MSTEQELESKKLILERTIELLVAAGHVTEGQVEKARKLAISLTQGVVET